MKTATVAATMTSEGKSAAGGEEGAEYANTVGLQFTVGLKDPGQK